MKDFFHKNGVLVLIIACLLTVLIWLGGALAHPNADPLSNLVTTITAPVRGAASAVMDWADGVYAYVFHYEQLNAELDALREQVAELEDKVRAAEEAARENEQLRDLLELREKRRDFDFETARVTARSASNWESTLTLSKGSAAGVQAGNCVISETGVLVGVVSTVGLNYAQVSTILNTDIELGGIVTRTYSAGILEGDFSLMGQGKLKLSYLPDTAQLVAGDEVVTSGKGKIYPSGLAVGKVEGVFTDPSGMTRYAVITPEANPKDVVEVFIIKDFDIEE